MFQCSTDNEEIIVNGQDGTSFVLVQDEYIESNYSDGYAIKCSELTDGQLEFRAEIIDKKGNVAYKIELPSDSLYNLDNIIMLKEGLYSYRYKDECHVKTW